MAPPRKAPLKIGLALGSGGARGWAHLGVLRRLSEFGVEPACIAGTSIGSIAGALYASGSLATMEDLATHLDWTRVAQLFFEVGLPRSGLLTGKNFMKMLRSVIPAHAVSSLRVPFAAVATDLESEAEVVLDSGSLFTAIRASIGIPGIFTPTCVGGRYLVDGGLVNPLPVSVCRAMGADYVIAVDINLRAAPHRRLRRTPPASRPPPRIARLTENQITRRELEIHPPDLLIQPEVGDIMTLEFHRGPEAIDAGVRAADEALPHLVALGVAMPGAIRQS